MVEPEFQDVTSKKRRCPYCEKIIHAKSLTRHIKSVHEKICSHLCAVEGCGYTTSRKDHLRAHMMKRHSMD